MTADNGAARDGGALLPTDRAGGRGAAALDGAARGVLAGAAAGACRASAAVAALARASAALAARPTALAGRFLPPWLPPRTWPPDAGIGVCAGVWGAAVAQRFANDEDSSAPKPSSPSSAPRPPRSPSEGPPPMAVPPPKPPKPLEPLTLALPLPRRSRRMCSVRAWPEPEEACASAKPSCCSRSAQTSCRYHLRSFDTLKSLMLPRGVVGSRSHVSSSVRSCALCLFGFALPLLPLREPPFDH